ncbi:lipopolysaccharide 1,6-galactosyltransferase [Citrobacter amalonaticus]|uniref:lipopolysaccharide 1,6-galactosyltransferase n=1 Tax=Citrobacter amalonaticus TaxID=35703 RepID=UPI00300C95F2
MKIAFVGEAVSGFGGMETVIRDVIHNFQTEHAEISCEMFFFCRHDKMDKAWLKGIDYTCSFSNIRLGFFRRAKHIHAFSQWLKKTKPDVVICIDVLSCLLASKAREKSAVSFVLFSWPHFSLDHKKHAECITWADYHLAISSGIKEQMMARGIADQNITIVYNPVSRKTDIIPQPKDSQPAVFLYVGRMKFEGQKRIKDLLDGLSRAEGEWHLHVIGDGSDFQKCQDYGQELGIADCITWHGWQISPWEVVKHDIKNVSALLLTSSFEGFPMTLLEAMSYGIPCISSDCMSGPRDMIRPGINGDLYPPNNIDHFTLLLNEVIAGKRKYNNNIIPATIDNFYNEVYFKNLKSVIFSKINK